MTVSVTSWWYFLCAIAALNILAWSVTAATFRRRHGALPVDAYRMRRLQLVLSAVYVFGCAFRSALPVYDVPRICLFDFAVSSVVVGRSVATVAELCFVAQWALMLHEISRTAGSLAGRVASLAVVPLIAIAEICSWYSVLTTSNIGHVAEETIWGLSVALLVGSVIAVLPRSPASRRSALLAWCVAGFAYVIFMFTVDVPMYWSRWIADEAVGRHYMSIAQGLLDVSQRRVVSHRWNDWKNEVAWMSLYFSVAVWISISLIHAPPPKRGAAAPL
ncbi:MAG: hypothetical protein JWN43_1437 [Gammaproteobacteria bacterium]|nr:hypothetical protein [Gammaproteobacteria bacterium]